MKPSTRSALSCASIALAAHLAGPIPAIARSRAKAAANDGRVVGPHHAAAAGQGERLDDARETRRRRPARGIGVERARKPGRRQAGPTQPLARQQLVARRRRRRRRMARQAERLGDAARRSPSADRRRPARRRSGAREPRATIAVDRCRLVVEPDRNRRSRQGSSSTWHRSVAKTSSTPSRAAASPNARVW